MPSPFAQDLNGRHLKNSVFFNDFAKGQQRRKKHESQIVYNMDAAPFVLRYEQETIQLNTIKRTAVSVTEIAVFFNIQI